MSIEGGSKNVSNTAWRGSGIQYGRARLGGDVIRLKAAAALKAGQVVYLSADFTVNISATLTDHDEAVGIVVGGENTNMQVLEDPSAYNSFTVADANEDVLVQISGVAYVITDAAIAVGLKVIPDTVTAGRVKAGTTAGLIVGKLLEASTGVADIAKILMIRD
jgi:hypothetical protein